MDLDRCFTFFATHDTAARYQLQGDGAVQLRWPTDGKFKASSRKQILIRREEHSIAAHVDCPAEADFIGILAIEDLVANLTLDGEAI